MPQSADEPSLMSDKEVGDGSGVPVVSVDRLSMAYAARGKDGAFWAVRDVSLQVGAGEIVGLVGGSGSGKSSLARCVAGLQPFQQGRIRFDDGTVLEPGSTRSVPRVRGVQMAYQDPAQSLNPRRTVRSVLEEILSVHRLCNRDERADRVRSLLADVGLKPDAAELLPSAMSGGMCQRVAIARALALEPHLLIADEIVSALDASVQAQVLNLLLDTRDRTGISVLFITHDLAVVNQVCDRVLVLSEGRVVEEGAVAQVLAHPKDEYTKRLMAAANTVDFDFTRGAEAS